ncbi:SPFH domain, Band 7 family protein [Oceanithermus profundus DSM 14977]|uniref:SPFH domain, Band 7 family protein n=1 Tax=Oceanithermus profundus (strain DSM 14977 / NBRC 100410 / VKM B-2274 / 506) TaxID=670487 RepID=E4U9Z5_OCEP5|nr:SPFH domain, Band 7 family protein [Oceanithermus profundus DSM 14977]
MGILLIVALVAVVLGIGLLAQPGRRSLGTALILTGLLLGVVSRSFVVVPAGHVGVVFNVFSGVQPDALDEGLHFVLPLVQEVVLYDARLQEVTLSKSNARRVGFGPIQARSKEGLDIGVDVTVQYRIEKAKAPLLHKEVGPAYRETMIVPQIRSKVRDAVGLFNAAELISTRRGDLERSVTTALREALAQKHIILESVLLREIRIPDTVARVIEEKQTAEQQVQIEENRRRQAEIAAQRRVIEAQAERDAAILKAEGEAKALELRGEALKRYPQVIQLTVAEKLAPNIKTIMLPTDGNFLLDLRKLEEAAPAR